MKMYPRTGEKRRFDDIDVEDEEAIGTLCRLSGGHGTSQGCNMDSEKRMRREIANSNERRRMQSINAGFASLKNLLPNKDGEKLSKAAILQHTASYIYKLERERTDLLKQNNALRDLIKKQEGGDTPEVEAQINEILAAISDLNDPICPDKLPNTEFHKARKGEALVEEVGAMEEVSSSETDIKDEYDDDSPPQPPMHVKLDFDRERKRRTAIHDKMKSLIYPKTSIEYTEDCIEKQRDSPVDYNSYPVKDPAASPTSTIVIPPQTTTTSTTCRRYSTNNTTTSLPPHKQQSIHRNSASPAATIVTILPPSSSPHHTNAVSTISVPTTMIKSSSRITPSVVEVVCSNSDEIPKVEVEPTSRIPTPDQLLGPIGAQYMTTSGGSPHHAISLHPHEEPNFSESSILITNSPSGAGQSCQKSLDTICEAIRHLEGDHMFSNPEDPHHAPVDVRNEEQIVTTEETYSIQDSQEDGAFLNQEMGSVMRCANVLEICTSNSKPFLRNGVTESHHLAPHHHGLHLDSSNSMIYNIEKHIVSPEPQEVPLELTTTHRLQRISSPPPHHHHHHHTFTTPRFIQAPRPGVIVVKQA